MTLDLWLIIVSVLLLFVGLGLIYSPPLKVLVNLEFLYLLVGVFLMVSVASHNSWWYVFFITFSACEGVFVLTLNMVVGKFVSLSSSNVFYKW